MPKEATETAPETAGETAAPAPLPVFAVIEAGANPDRWRDQWESVGKGRSCMLLRTRAAVEDPGGAAQALESEGLKVCETYEDRAAAARRAMQLERHLSPKK